MLVVATLPGMVFDILSGTQASPDIGVLTIFPLGLFLALFWRITRFPPVPAIAVILAVWLLTNMFDKSAWAGPHADHTLVNSIALLAGLPALAAATWLDITDIRRETRRSQVAFWLHVVAGMLIARGALTLIGDSEHQWTAWNFFQGGSSLAGFGLMLLLTLAALILSLVLDRRALLLSFAIPLMFIGGLLLPVVSFKWHGWRKRVLAWLPVPWVAQLPRLDIAPTGQRPSRQHKPLSPRRFSRQAN